MADSINPNANSSNSANFLPRFYRSDSNKKFLQATVDQLIQPGTVNKINGFIGRQNSKATTSDDIFIAAATATRQNYQLEPALIVKDQLDTTTFFKDYQDYINQLGVFGSNVTNHARLNEQEFYSWDPHIDWDKFVNFQNYYWLPYGPDTIRIVGQQAAVISTYQVAVESQLDSYEYLFTPNGLTRNPTIKLYRGQTYKFEINSPNNPFSIKTARSAGSLDRYVTPGLDKSAVEVGTITFTIPFSAPDVLYYQSESNIDLGGVWQILSIEDNTSINVTTDLLGKTNYQLPDGTALSNGMKVSFYGNVTPASFAVGNYYVEGVGTAIKLVNEAILELVSPYTTSESILFDSTPFDKQPFSDATAYAGSVDYIVINRSSMDHNPWSRYNRWFHISVIDASAKFNGKVPSVDQTARAARPVIEFNADLKLFNFGTTAILDVDLIDTFTTDVFSTIEGTLGYNVDGINLAQNQRILFTADTDSFVKNKIYQVTFIDVLHSNSGTRQIHLVPVSDPVLDQVVLVQQGVNNQGSMYWYNGTEWLVGQQKTTLNQAPLFDVVDSSGVSYSDINTYDGSTFSGTKLFSYKVGTGTLDPNLGFALAYKNINNIGDIVFNFNLITDKFQYKNITEVITQKTDVGYLVKTDSVTGTSYLNGWQTSVATTTQAGIRIYKNSNQVNNFELDMFDDKYNLNDLVVRVYVNGIRLDTSKWSMIDAPVYNIIVLATDITPADIITFKTFASQPINSNGYYEIPINLQNNPLNGTMVDFTLGEVLDHVNSIVENLTNFAGVFPGNGNLKDLGNITNLGTKFVQHSGPLSLSAYHVTSESNNIVRAIEQNRDDYSKFKRNFIAVSTTLGVDTDTVTHANLILQAIAKDKPNNSPYFFSDMVAFGASLHTELAVVDYRIKTYPLSAAFSLDTLSTKAVYVYLNGTQLLHGRDYSFNSQGFISVTATLIELDTITIYEYENTDGCFIPETPTKLGIWPKYEPKIYLDTSLITPRTMIQGHDGSQILAYGDYRDALILELEKRIYNNIKVTYDSNIFDIYDIIPGYNRSTSYSLTEFNAVLAPSFYKWTSLVDRDFTKPLSYDRANPFTFNYRGHVAPDGRETPGYWRGIYIWLLGTDRPNICPWEILGFTEEPTWWTSAYGPAPYTSDNLVMWQDISLGLVNEPGALSLTLAKFARPFLIDHIPVDGSGNLISPITSGLSNGIITANTSGDFVFGDVSPIESAWRRSSHYPFSVLLTSMLIAPAKTFGTLLDRSRIVRNLTGQLIYKDTGLRVTPADVKLPSIFSSTTRVQTSGIINYLVNYILSDNLKSYTSYAYDLKNITANLSYRLGAFTSKEKFNLLLDSKTPASAGSVFIPQENFDIILNSSSPVRKITYSGVIITKLADGFEVKGYSRTQPYFKYYAWVQSGVQVNVGGISESFTTWTSGQQYAPGKIVKFNNRFYRVIALHTATTTFESAYYQVLPALPMIGGRDAILRKQWDRTDAITVPYGTTFKTIQEVVDFLLGYGEHLKDQGFIFDDFNTAMGQVSNWETSAKEFLFWTTQNWSTGEDKWEEWLPNTITKFGSIVRFNGDYYRAIRNSEASTIFIDNDFAKLDGLSTVGSSVISLSPAAGKLTFSAPLCVVDDIRNAFNGYEIFKVDGSPIEPNFLNSYREDNSVSYTVAGTDGIFGASFYLVQKEQIVILNNSTMFNDTIYNLESGYKQDRIKVAGYVSTNWMGAFNAPGFIFDQAVIQEWNTWTDYALGDTVKYKEFYYSASSFLPGTEKFVSTSWIKLDKKPTARLLPNWTYKASQFEDFYSLDSDNFDVEQQKMAQHLIGYQKRQYLENIIQDDVSEFKFYQGMIIEKGTQNSLNKLFDVLSSTSQESVQFYEEWALRVGQYGASSAFENIEFIIPEADVKNNPQGFELVETIDQTSVDFIVRQTPNDVYLKPLGYNSKPFPAIKNYKSYLRSPGHVRASDVHTSLKTIDDIVSVDISTFTTGDYVWCSFENTSWNVYRYSDANIVVTNVTFSGASLTVTAQDLIQLPVSSYVGITRVAGFSGFYKIASVKLNVMVLTASNITVESPFTHQSNIVIHALVTQRTDSIDNADTALPSILKAGELLWTGTEDTGYRTWEYAPAFKASNITNSSPAPQLTYGKEIALNLSATIAAISTSQGEVIVYDKSGLLTPWIQRQTIVEPFIAIGDAYGTNPNSANKVATVLAMSQDSVWLATGSPLAGSVATILVNGLLVADPTGVNSVLPAQGVVSIYKKDANNIYTLEYTVASPYPAAYEMFGSSLAFDNNTLFVGAIGDSSNTGEVYKLQYSTLVNATTAYNPNGSTGTTVIVTSTTGISAGMAITGTGFTTGQLVTGVVNAYTLLISAAPDADPAGVLTFTNIEWNYDLAGITTGTTPGTNYGHAIALSKDSTTLVVAAPGTTSPGEVFIYKNTNAGYELFQTITGTDVMFGHGITVSSTGEYIAISSLLADGTKLDQGSVTVYNIVGAAYVVYQELANHLPEVAGLFGTKIEFMNDYKTLVVYGQNTDTSVISSLDSSSTTFDNQTTMFATKHPNSGRIDIYDRYATKWVFSESLTTNNESNDGYGAGFAVGNNRILIGAPYALDQDIKSGKVYEYGKLLDAYSWTVARYEIARPDVSKIKKVFLYNKSTNELVTYLDVVDPTQNKIPGIAEEEIKYKTFYDPAVYSVGDSSANVDDGMAWAKSQVGMLWWDLRTAKFINSYDSDIVYRNSTWNMLATGASIDIYEWVETLLLPAAWDAQSITDAGIAAGISGTSLYGNTTYAITRRYDSISKSFKNTYYYWVKSKKTVPNIQGRNMSAQDVANLISNPRGEGYKYLALTGLNSFSLVNVKQLLVDTDVVLSIEYWTIDKTDQNIHSQWKLISNGPDSQIPNTIEQKWVDSLCGRDQAGRTVPDTALPPKLRYGVENRPRQGMFVNRFEALKEFVEQTNKVLITYQITNEKNILALDSYDAEPTTVTGLYDTIVDTDSELRFANVGSFKRAKIAPVIVNGAITGITILDAGNGYLVAPYITIVGSGIAAVARTIINVRGKVTGIEITSPGTGYDINTVFLIRDYSVLVHSDSQASNTWSIYSYDPLMEVWSRMQSQKYDTRKYWNYADWFATGVTQFSAIDFAVDTFVDLNSITTRIGQLVKIRTTNAGTWLLLEKYAESTSIDWTQSYTVVGSQNGTIQLSSSLYAFTNTSVGYDGSLYDGSIFDSVASTELRIILTSLKDDIFIDNLLTAYIDLFFTSIRYAMSEQTYLDWVFKTSFVKAKHNVGELQQSVTYRTDNLANFEDYIAEVKPYRTKVREFISAYDKTELSQLSLTDFDLPSVYESGKMVAIDTTVTNGIIESGNTAIQTYPWKHWLDNVGFVVTTITLVDGGSGYLTEPVVRISSTSGTGATARAFISNGKINRIILLTPGTKYLSAPTVTIDGGLAVTGVAATAVAIIGESVVRSNLIKMKFDRVTQTYFITQLQETEVFIGTGSRLQFPLKWAPDIRIGQSTVVINGVDALRDSYALRLVKSTAKGYTSYSGSITFDTAIAANATVTITYLKDWSLLNAADRIQYYYTPGTGELGKDLSQLMTGIDYGGVIINGLGFEVASGWGSLPFYSDKWDSFDATYDDYFITVAADTHSFTLPYLPTIGTAINVYYIQLNVESYTSDGSTLGYTFNLFDDAPVVTVDRTVLSIAPTITAGATVIKIVSTVGIKIGDIVTTNVTGMVGYNTTVVSILNSTDITLDQILFTDMPAGTSINFGRTLVQPTDVTIFGNGTILLTTPIAAGSIISINSPLVPVRIDDVAYNTVNQTNSNAVMTTPIADGVSSTFAIPDTFAVSTGDQFILRKSTSDGSITPQAADYDTALSGGNLAYSSATGIAADDILIDGDGFVTPTTSPAPEEVVPGQVVDTVAIKVYDQPSSGSANIKVDSYIADGVTTTFAITQILNSPQAVIVKTTDGSRDVAGNLTSVSVVNTVTTDFTVDYAARTVTFTNAPADKQIVSIFSFGFSGSGILDLDYFIGDGTTREFITKAPWLVEVTSLIYVNGMPVNAELFKTDATYDAAQRIGIRFSIAPVADAVINFVIVSGSSQTFAITKTERIATTGALTYNLANIIGDSLPTESNMLVRVNQEILKGPNNSYFTIKSNRLTYVVDPAKFLPYSVSVGDIIVLANGKLLRLGTDYTVDLSGVTIKLNKLTYKNFANTELIISIKQGQGYSYTPPLGIQSPKITFSQAYDDTHVVEVISSYKHDILDIQRTAVNVTSTLVIAPDTLEYYNYTGVAGGIILLDRTVIDDNYVWVIKNGTILTPSVDFKLNPDKKSIKLALIPASNDEFALITYGSNVLTSGIAYMQFKDMLNRTHFKRLSLNKQTRLTTALNYNDITIQVDDASNFDVPNAANNRPGVVEIRGERIEYFAMSGNVLSQLRRGTLGTGTPLVHNARSYVQDIGPSETIPYSEVSTIEQIVSDGTHTINLNFVPTKAASVWEYDAGFTSSIPATYGQSNDIEVFVGGYDSSTVWAPNAGYTVGTIVTVGSYTYRCTTSHTSALMFNTDAANWQFFVGNIRLKKKPYVVHNVNQAANSPEGDVQLDAEFAVDGTTQMLRLTTALLFGTRVTVVKRTGIAWDSAINVQADDGKIARFLKVTPGIWYTDIKN